MSFKKTKALSCAALLIATLTVSACSSGAEYETTAPETSETVVEQGSPASGIAAAILLPIALTSALFAFGT